MEWNYYNRMEKKGKSEMEDANIKNLCRLG